jgi:DNA-binding transcriptional ArsR family regulator
MAARIALGIRSCRAHLKRLSVAFAVELRLKIITELYMRPMGPTQFYREFGGGSPSRVARHFKRLEEDSWLRCVGNMPGQGGRGTEKLYRATELAFIDAETSALIPYSMRVTASWNIFNQIAAPLSKRIEESNLEARPKRDLTCTSFLVDQIGWERVIKAVDARFTSLFEEQEDAQLRASKFGVDLLRADVFQIAFEAPTPGDRRIGLGLVESRKEPMIPFVERLAPVFADEVRMRIVEELNRRPMSVKEFYREFSDLIHSNDVSLRSLYRRFERLEELGWLVKVDEKTGGRRRGATEQFFRATRPAIDESGPWVKVPDSLSQMDSWKTFERLSAQVKQAMKAGTFDARPDRYLAWSLLQLDQQGWEKVIAELDDLLSDVLEEQERAKVRMKKSGEKPIKMTVALAAFESARDPAKAP